MCEGTVFLVTDGVEEEVMRDVLVLEVAHSRLLLVDLFGERKEIKAKVKNIDFSQHKVIIKEI